MSGTTSAVIYGSIDGLITTNSIISSIQGANLKTLWAIVFGFANLLADGFSMGISSYLSSDSLSNAFITFLSFILIGTTPILPFFFTNLTTNIMYVLSHILTLCALFLIGVFKGYTKNESIIKHTLIIVTLGGITTFIAYYVSKFITDLHINNN